MDSSESIGTASGDGRGRLEISKSDGSKVRRSSKFAAKRKVVSECERRWWLPRDGGMVSKSITTGGGFLVKLFCSIETKNNDVFFFSILRFVLLFFEFVFVLKLGSGGGG